MRDLCPLRATNARPFAADNQERRAGAKVRKPPIVRWMRSVHQNERDQKTQLYMSITTAEGEANVARALASRWASYARASVRSSPIRPRRWQSQPPW